MFDVPTESDRRGFLTRATAGAAMMALATLPEWASAETPAIQDPGIDSNAAWLRGMNQKRYKQFFETGSANNFIPLLHVVNYFGAWRATTGVRENDVAAVVGVFGMAVPMVFGDAMWQKYELGKAINLTDASTSAGYTRNPYLAPRNGELFGSDATTVAAVQRMGAKFLLCNNAFGFWMMRIAAATNQQVAAVRAEFLPHLAAGVTIVPAMVQAIEQAQRADLTYMKNS
jgi:hypothetical protein